MESSQVHAVVLAAGCSSRLGHNKQLIDLGGQPLIRRAVGLTRDAGVRDITVVTGFDPGAVAGALAGMRCALVHAAAWANGMGASLKVGVAHATSCSESPGAILVVLPDQVLVTAAHLAALITAAGTDGTSVVATRYAETLGAPVLFQTAYFAALLALPPDVGAKQLLKRYASAVTSVDHEATAFDLDTPADLDAVRQLIP